MTRPILMLDIDGVLVTRATCGKRPRAFAAGPLAELVRVYRETNCRIVLSSTWRCDPRWRETMIEHGLLLPLHDRTPDLRLKAIERGVDPTTLQTNRGHEVAEWRRRHRSRGTYAIVDDDADFNDEQKLRLVQTTFEDGLTPALADRLIALLKE